ncbi:hypothetical protein MMYC01_210529 [Madurella mycetomatis]|uniref:Azaphilone pigments biosynthesis cluster protein L N-terminal domain-containing protein n=1 Tax=Madurella mycetomatis TaxID=100816 RepID=A0A175VPC6_9PEZI|nr:hypothetical protein MMYC01_210529 [Madurella mycetomatis]
MADPLSVSASVVAVVTAAIQSAKSLAATVKRYKDRNKTLQRLQHELEDLTNVLSSLKDAANSDSSILALLEGPVERCSQVCREFEDAMEKFSGKSKTGLMDWAKLEFMRGDINDFMDTLASYKSTIMIAVGTITIEMIKDTAYDLELRLQRIETYIATESTISFDTSIDLQDEREVTKQCLRICQDAQSYLESLQDRPPFSRREAGPRPAGTVQNQFDAELLTSQALNESRVKVVETISRLQERLASVASNQGPERERQMAQLLEDINISKQCLEVCGVAADQVHHRKIHTVGEVVADDDTDQVVVTTLADLFDVRKVLAKNRSAQLVGSMTDETVQKVSGDRYNSRFGAVAGIFGHAQTDTTTSSSHFGIQEESTRRQDPMTKQRQPRAEPRQNRPSPNQVRKRSAEGEGGA